MHSASGPSPASKYSKVSPLAWTRPRAGSVIVDPFSCFVLFLSCHCLAPARPAATAADALLQVAERHVVTRARRAAIGQDLYGRAVGVPQLGDDQDRPVEVLAARVAVDGDEAGQAGAD